MLKDLKSRKFIVAIGAAILIIVNDALGKPVSDEAVYSALGLLGTYVLGQGLADHGAQGAATAARRAVEQGGDMAKAVQGALGVKADDGDSEEDGPGWNDVSDMDADDKKELLG